MNVTRINRLATILALAIPVFLISMSADAGNRGSGGAAGNGPNSERIWQGRQEKFLSADRGQQGKQGSAGEKNNSSQQKFQNENQTRAKKTIRQRLRDNDIYGHRMMTSKEMQNYRARLNAAPNDREWARLRAEHQQQMMQRAEQRGIALDPPIYGRHMLTRKERQRFERRMAAAASVEERSRIREEHREMIQQRSRELGLGIPPYDGD